MKFPLRLQSFAVFHRTVALFVPDAVAVRTAYEAGEIPFPYWSKVWPAAVALADFLDRQPECVLNKRVMELGGGLGLPSVVAAAYASSVYCTDAEPVAVACVRQSATHNGLHNITAGVLGWQHLPEEPQADVLLLSDVNYEPAAFEALKKTIRLFLANNAVVILSTPQRLMAKGFVASLLPFCKRQEDVTVEGVPVTVMVLQE